MEFFDVLAKRRTIRDFENEEMPIMNQLLIDWNLSDKEQQVAYRNAVPKQYKMLLDDSVIVIPLSKQKTDILHPDNISHLNGFASI